MQLHEQCSDVSRVLCVAHGKDNLYRAVKGLGSSNAVGGWVPPALGSMKTEPTVPFGLPIAIRVIQLGLPPQLCSTPTRSTDKISSEVRRMD